MKRKQIFCLLTALALIIATLAGCGRAETSQAEPVFQAESSEPSVPAESGEAPEAEESAPAPSPSSEVGNEGSETDGPAEKVDQAEEPRALPAGGVGLKNVKVDSSSDLTEAQKIVLQYYDNDYLALNYEAMARYPTVYEGAQLAFHGIVEKIISSSKEEYEVLLWVGEGKKTFNYRLWKEALILDQNDTTAYQMYREETASNLVILKGRQTDERLIPNDAVYVYGRYASLDTTVIDGVSYTIPTINAYRTFAVTNDMVGLEPDKFDNGFLKKLAKAVFGEDIELRNPVEGTDYINDGLNVAYGSYSDDPFLICELENQSKANFTKFRLYKKHGNIEDGRSPKDIYESGAERTVNEDGVARQFIVTPDLGHYLIYRYNEEMNSLSLGYYDRELKKIWGREFEETIHFVYDYTATTLYVVANNDLYTIDLETGEDAAAPVFVGEKTEIRKVEDGFILIAASKADTFVKLDSNYQVVWRTNVMDDEYNDIMGYQWAVQLIEDRIVFAVAYGSKAYEVDAASGEIKVSALSVEDPVLAFIETRPGMYY